MDTLGEGAFGKVVECIDHGICDIPNEHTALIGIAEKAGVMKATVEVTNGRGDLTVVHKRIGIVNRITGLKNLIVII